jgi:diguanylate cyclase (GGDEF)-like protein
VISLGKFLNSSNEVDDRSYVNAIGLLLEGLKSHTLDYNREDHERFQVDVLGCQGKLLPGMPVPDLFVLVGQVIKTFEEYNRRTAGKLRSQFSEFQSIISGLGEAVGKMAFASDASLARLNKIQSQLAATEQIDDLRMLKTRLFDCLVSIADEVEEHKKLSTSGMTTLAEGARDLDRSIEVTRRSACDPVTGLPMRRAAESALLRVAEGGISAVAVVFLVKRLKQVNSRYGYEAGDGLLAKLAAHLKSGVRPEEGMYRWSGASFLGIITRNTHFEIIRRSIAMLIASTPGYEITSAGRSAIIPVALDWTSFPVIRPVDKLVGQLEMFVDDQDS